MYIWIMYDISSSKIRRKVARLCKQAGLHRVQASVFVGKTKLRYATKAFQEAQSLIHQSKDKLLMMETTKEAFRRIEQTGMPAHLPQRGDIMML